jgi:hypothetical protein
MFYFDTAHISYCPGGLVVVVGAPPFRSRLKFTQISDDVLLLVADNPLKTLAACCVWRENNERWLTDWRTLHTDAAAGFASPLRMRVTECDITLQLPSGLYLLLLSVPADQDHQTWMET